MAFDLLKFGYRLSQLFFDDFVSLNSFKVQFKSYAISHRIHFQDFSTSEGLFIMVIAPKRYHSDVIFFYKNFCVDRRIPPLYKE